MRVTSMLHPVITVSDMETALSFYRDLLGLQVAMDIVHDPDRLSLLLGVPDPDVRAVILTCPDGTEVELAEFRKPRGADRSRKRFEDAGITFVTLLVDDIDGVTDALQARGYRLHGPIVEYSMPDPGVKVVYCYGPDGTPLTLAEFLEKGNERG